MEHKHLIITIDTEGDNLWAWREGQPIGTENTRFLPPFQSLCEEYGMKPVYLSNYEMLQDPRFCAFATPLLLPIPQSVASFFPK